MKKLIFHRYKMDRLLSVRQLTSVHYLADCVNYDTPRHSHSAWEFVYCDRGRATVWDDARRIELGPGEIAFHQGGIPHHIHVGRNPATLFVMSFTCTNECMKLFSRKRLRVNEAQRQIISLMIGAVTVFSRSSPMAVSPPTVIGTTFFVVKLISVQAVMLSEASPSRIWYVPGAAYQSPRRSSK